MSFKRTHFWGLQRAVAMATEMVISECWHLWCPFFHLSFCVVKGGNEAGTLERTLHQLTGLLQIGFGEAGSSLISKSMNTDSSDLNPLVDGRFLPLLNIISYELRLVWFAGTRMLGLFGFCDIRRFTDATECLKEEVMLYVNRIAQIVHSEVRIKTQ